MTKVHSNILLAACLFLAGCRAPASPPQVKNLSQAQDRFVKICKNEYNYDAIVKSVEKTEWVYIPVKKHLFQFEAQNKLQKETSRKPKPYSLQYINGDLSGGTFNFEFDVIPTTKVQSQNGVGTNYTEEFTKIQNNVFTTLMRSYFDLESTIKERAGIKINPGTKNPQLPDFFVVIIADVTTGIESRSLFYSLDYQGFINEVIPHEEYIKRYITDVFALKTAIHDTYGKHLEYNPVSWPEFLIKQVINRARFKYQESSFPPGPDTVEEMLKIVSETLRAYKFSGFEQVRLRDLRNRTEYLYDRTRIMSQPSAPLPSASPALITQ